MADGTTCVNFYRATLFYRGIYCRRVSVRPSHTSIVSKWLNIRSRKQRHTIAHGVF